MAVVTFMGRKYHGEKVPVKGISRTERAREIRSRIDDGRLVPAGNKPRKPNPHKGKSCALWVDKEFNTKGAKPVGLEWNLPTPKRRLPKKINKSSNEGRPRKLMPRKITKKK